jgi:ACS family glucarate transporter-like MFS transporter
LLWFKAVYSPREHPRLSPAELSYIERGGGLVDMDQGSKSGGSVAGASPWSYVKELLGNRMLLGIFLAQYCIATVTAFFLTWFPIYLMEARGMSILRAGFAASLPALCGFGGGIFGGVASDRLLKAGRSLTFARKAPIVVGMLLSVSIIACNYVHAQWAIIVIMALAFLGKGIGALGWAVLSDASPKQIAGLSGGLFNMFGNISSITTPIVIGYILKGTGAFNGALVFIGAHALAAILIYLLMVGEIKRVVLKTVISNK